MNSKVNGRPERQTRLKKTAANLRELSSEAMSYGDDFLAYLIDLAVKETQGLLEAVETPNSGRL